MKAPLLAALLLAGTLATASAADPAIENPQIDFEGFVTIATKLADVRENRRVTLEEFLKMAQEPGTMVLDTRSRANYDRKHIKGAVHLNFSEMTEKDLARVIPNKDTRILIYCNNNFSDNSDAFYAKSPPMALNIPTFITLHSYGYENLYELGPVVSENDERLEFASLSGPGQAL